MNGIKTRRVYDPPSPEDGARLLVDRLWPRGVKKWKEFQRRYFAQLDENPLGWQPILRAAREGRVTLLYSAKDTEHNNAAALKTFLQGKKG